MYLKLLDTQKKKSKESVQDETGFILSKKIKQVLFGLEPTMACQDMMATISKYLGQIQINQIA